MARFIALDWDQNQLHLIAGNSRGSSVQVQRASVTQEGQTPTLANVEELGKLLRDRLKELGVLPAPLLACVGRDRFILKEVRFPAVPDAEEPGVVRFQTVKELTDSADDVVIDYVVTGETSSGERKAAAMVVRKEVLAAYQALAQAAGLKLAALTPRLIGVSACVRKVMGATVVTPPPEPADGAIAVVVVGEKTAEVCVLRGGAFHLSRSVPAGNNLASEVRRNLSVYAGGAAQQPVRAVYVTGKGSGELRERLGELVEVPVYTFDPFAGSESLELPVGQRGAFAGAMGLLLTRAEGGLPINFASPRQPKPPQNLNYRYARLAGVACVAFLVGLFVLSRVVLAGYDDDLAALKADLEKTEEQLKNTQLNAKRLKGVDDWDNAVTLDELYDLNARIPNVNSLRIKSIHTELLTRTAKSRFVARWTIKGELLNRGDPRGPLDQLVDQFRRDGYYAAESPDVQGRQFTLVVNVERRPPGEYKAVVKEPTAAPAAAARTRPDPLDMGEDDPAEGPPAAGPPAGRGAGRGTGRGTGPDAAPTRNRTRNRGRGE